MAALDVVVAGLLNCVEAALAGTPGGPVGRVCDVPGLLAWDDCQCGLLALTVDRVFPSATFPTEAFDEILTAACPPPYEAVDLTVTVLRCAPNMDSRGNPPTCAQLAAAAEVWAFDIEAVRGAIVCCMAGLVGAGTVEEWTLRATDPAGPEGGCVGADTHVTVGLMACGCLAGVR